MDAKEKMATDGGSASSIDHEELYTTVYSATRDAMYATIATVIFLLLAAFFVFGGVSLALSNSDSSSIVWG